MKALRKIVKAENRKITLEIPADFAGDQDFEVIVLPVGEDKLETDIDYSAEKRKKTGRKNAFGKYKGQIWISPDFDEPLEDFKEYM